MKFSINVSGALAECIIEGIDGSEDRFIVKGDPSGDHAITLAIACSCTIGRLQGSPEDSGRVVSGPWAKGL